MFAIDAVKLLLHTFVFATSLVVIGGCSLVPEKRSRQSLHNPFPQLKKVAVLPFFNQSENPTLDTGVVTEQYYAELQLIPGFEVLPNGVTRRMLGDYIRQFGEPVDGAGFQALARFLDVEAVIVGSVTDFDAYYPPRMALTTQWYAANPGYHPIPAGYGLPWGTDAEEKIPRRIVREAEFEIARAQLDTQTPEFDASAGTVPRHGADHGMGHGMIPHASMEPSMNGPMENMMPNPAQVFGPQSMPIEDAPAPTKDAPKEDIPAPTVIDASEEDQANSAIGSELDNKIQLASFNAAQAFEPDVEAWLPTPNAISPTTASESIHSSDADVALLAQNNRPLDSMPVQHPSLGSIPGNGLSNPAVNSRVPHVVIMDQKEVDAIQAAQRAAQQKMQQGHPVMQGEMYPSPMMSTLPPDAASMDAASMDATSMNATWGEAIDPMEMAAVPSNWPDPTDLIPDSPTPYKPTLQVQSKPVLSHTRMFRGDDPYFTERLSDYVETGDDARPDGWQGYLRRSDDFIRFCCHLHLAEMLESRGGEDQSDLILRWPLSRY